MNTIYFDALTPETVRQAAEIITRGGLLGIPTETVYGLGANALNEEAVIILSLDLRHTQLQFILCILQRIIH